jgi:hypothetical protein
MQKVGLWDHHAVCVYTCIRSAFLLCIFIQITNFYENWYKLMPTYLRQANWFWNRRRSHINNSIINRINDNSNSSSKSVKIAAVVHWKTVADSRLGVVPYLWNGMRDHHLLTVRNSMFTAILRIRVTDYNELCLLGLWYLKINYPDYRLAGLSETSVHFYQTIWHNK